MPDASRSDVSINTDSNTDSITDSATDTSRYGAYKSEIVATARRLTEKGYLMATGGNLSLRIPDRRLRDHALELRLYADDGRRCLRARFPLARSRRANPSVESGMHAGIYQARADVQAVVHTHQVYASALALIGAPIPALFDEQARFLGRSVAIIPYGPSGTGFLKREQGASATSNNAYILQNHGVICFGHDLERAAHNVEILEKCALAYLLALAPAQSYQDPAGRARDRLRQAARRPEEGRARRTSARAASDTTTGTDRKYDMYTAPPRIATATDRAARLRRQPLARHQRRRRHA